MYVEAACSRRNRSYSLDLIVSLLRMYLYTLISFQSALFNERIEFRLYARRKVLPLAVFLSFSASSGLALLSTFKNSATR